MGAGGDAAGPGLAVLLVKCIEDWREGSGSPEPDNAGHGPAMMPAKRRRVSTGMMEEPMGLLTLPTDWANQASPNLAELRARIADSTKEPSSTVSSWQLKCSWDDASVQVPITSDQVLQALVSSWHTQRLKQGLAQGSITKALPKLYMYTGEGPDSRPSLLPTPARQQTQAIAPAASKQLKAQANYVPTTPVIGSRVSANTCGPSPQLHNASAVHHWETMASHGDPSATPATLREPHFVANQAGPLALKYEHGESQPRLHDGCVRLTSASPSSRRSVALPVTPANHHTRVFTGPSPDLFHTSGGQSLMELHVDRNGSDLAEHNAHAAARGLRSPDVPVGHLLAAGRTLTRMPSGQDLPPIRTLLAPFGAVNELNHTPFNSTGTCDMQGGYDSRMVVKGEEAQCDPHVEPTWGAVGMLRTSTITTGAETTNRLPQHMPRRSLQAGGLDCSGGGASPPPQPAPYGVTISTSASVPHHITHCGSARLTSGGGSPEDHQQQGAEGGLLASGQTGMLTQNSAGHRRRGSSVSLLTAASGLCSEDEQLQGRPSTNGKHVGNGSSHDDEAGDGEEGAEEGPGARGRKKGGGCGARSLKTRRSVKGRESDTKFADGRKKDEKAHEASMAVMIDACANIFGPLSHLVEVVDYKNIRCRACTTPCVVKAYSAYHTACIRKHFLRHHQDLLAEGKADPNLFKEYKVSSKPSKLGGSATDLEKLASTAAGVGTRSLTDLIALDGGQAPQGGQTGLNGDGSLGGTPRRTKRQAASNVSAAVAAEIAASGRGCGGPTRSGVSTPRRAAAKVQPASSDLVDSGTPQSHHQSSPFQEAAKLVRAAKQHLSGTGLSSRWSASQQHIHGINNSGEGMWPGMSSASLAMHNSATGVTGAWHGEVHGEKGQPWLAARESMGFTESAPANGMVESHIGSPRWQAAPPNVTTAMGSAAHALHAWGGTSSPHSQRLMPLPSFSDFDAHPLAPHGGMTSDLNPRGGTMHQPLVFPSFRDSSAIKPNHLHGAPSPGLPAEVVHMGSGLPTIDTLPSLPMSLDAGLAPAAHTPVTLAPHSPLPEALLHSPLSGPACTTLSGYDSMDPQSMVDFLSSLKRSGDWRTELASIRDQVGLSTNPSPPLAGPVGLPSDTGENKAYPPLAPSSVVPPRPPSMDGLVDAAYGRSTPSLSHNMPSRPSFGGHMFSGEGTILSAGALMQAMNQRSAAGPVARTPSPILPPALLSHPPGPVWPPAGGAGHTEADVVNGLGTVTSLNGGVAGQMDPMPSWPSAHMMLDSGSLEPVRRPSEVLLDGTPEPEHSGRESPPLDLAASVGLTRPAQGMVGGPGAGMGLAQAMQGLSRGTAQGLGMAQAATSPAGNPVSDSDSDDVPGFGFCSDKLLGYSYAQLLRVNPELQDNTPDSSGPM